MTSWVNPLSATNSIVSGFGTGSNGQLLTSNGGSTPSWTSVGTSTPTANTISKWDSNGLLNSNGSLISGVSQITGNTTFTYTTSGTPLPEYCTLNSSSNFTVTIPAYNGGIQQGRHCTFLNTNSSTAVVSIVEPGGTICSVYPGQCVKVLCRNVSVGSYIDAWGVFEMSQILAGDNALKVIGSSRTVSFSSNSTSIMDNSWPTEIITNTTVIVAGQINLPPAATLPQGQSYHFTWTNNGGAGSVNICNSAGTNLVQIGSAFSFSATCTLSNGTWVGLYGTNISVTAT